VFFSQAGAINKATISTNQVVSVVCFSFFSAEISEQ
jgi:hypothetical protein